MAKKVEHKNTPKPSGLKITRNGYKFTFSWKSPSGSDYKSFWIYIEVQKFTKKGDTYWSPISSKKLGNSATSSSITFTPKYWYPTRYKSGKTYKYRHRMTGIRFRLKQTNKTKETNKKKFIYDTTTTGWTVYDIKRPHKPTLKQSLQTYNKSKFTWNVKQDSGMKEWFKYTEIQTYFVKDSPSLKKIKNKFRVWNRQKGASGSKSYTEDSNKLRIKAKTPTYSYSRWVRARSKGPAGDSDWVYIRHVYAKPRKPVIKTGKNSGTWAKNNTVKGLNVNVRWTLTVTGNHPVDRVEVQYCIVVPSSQSLDFPPGSSWTTPANGVITDTKKLDACSFTIDNRLKDDECLYVRVVATHDNIPNESVPVRLNVGGKPTLAKPSGLTITDVDMSTYRAVVSALNNCSIPDSFLAVKFKKNDGKDLIVGYIPAGLSSAIIQFPPFAATDDVTVSVYAVTISGNIVTTEKAGYNLYSWTSTAYSDVLTQNGNIPVPPANFDVSRIPGKPSSVNATWKWSWANATELELSYAQDEDSWKSTDEPTSYIVNKTNAARWIIAQLEEGVTWYFRARFIRTLDSESTVGPWTDIKPLSLASVPAKPVLFITPDATSIDENFIASWGYISNDTTNQESAEVRRVEVTDGVVTKYTNIAKMLTGTTQKMSISPAEMELEDGNTYYFCVKVKSVSGESSEWSDPVPLAIADKPTVKLSETSLTTVPVPVEDVSDEVYIIEPVGYTETFLLESASNTITTDYSITSINEIAVRDKRTYTETIALEHVEEFDLDAGETEIDPKHDIFSVASIISYTVLSDEAEYDSSTTYYKVDTENHTYVVDTDVTEENFDEKRYNLYLQATVSVSDYRFTKETITLELDTVRQTAFVVTYSEYKDRVILDGKINEILDVTVNGAPVAVNFEDASVIFDPALSNGDVVNIVYNVVDLVDVPTESYSFSNNTITFNQQYSAGDTIIASYQNLTSNVVTVQDPIASVELIMAGDTEIRDYTFSDNVITLGTSLEPSTEVEITYIPDRTITTYGLTRMPLTADITTNITNPTVRYTVTRAETYPLDRPDESKFVGYVDEVMVNYAPSNGTAMEVEVEDLLYNLDDGCDYKLSVMITDSVGQKATDEMFFTVQWTNQAKIPEAQFEIYEDEKITVITPIAPAGADVTNDRCDIYRLSVDKPELIVKGGTFGTQYVDPYPAIGEFGGHRIVYVTSNGDYITPENKIAYVDIDYEDGNTFDYDYQIIDFGDSSVDVLYNVDLSSSWKKDFQETKYLGGHIQGDWNPAVSRTGSINSVSVIPQDQEQIKGMRRLAAYSGICHVRTRDGSSYPANVDVSEDMSYNDYDLATYSLNVTRVDSEGLDGMTLAEWRELHPIEQEE